MSTRPELDAARAADFEESPQIKISRLERTLSDERTFALKSTRQLHRVLSREVRATEKNVVAAERRAVAAERRASTATARAERAEAEVQALRSSTTWKAGRAIVAIPATIKQRIGRG